MKGGSSRKVVEPGDTSSNMVNCVKQTADPEMPPEGEILSGAQIALIVKWIEGGHWKINPPPLARHQNRNLRQRFVPILQQNRKARRPCRNDFC